MTGPKGIAAADFLGAGLRRSGETSTSTREPVHPWTGSAIAEGSAPAAPARQRYGRATFYLRPDQIAWVKGAVGEIATDGSVSSSDIARVALDLAAGLSMEELRRRVVERAAVEGVTFPGRHNRGMPSPIE